MVWDLSDKHDDKLRLKISRGGTDGIYPVRNQFVVGNVGNSILSCFTQMALYPLIFSFLYLMTLSLFCHTQKSFPFPSVIFKIPSSTFCYIQDSFSLFLLLYSWLFFSPLCNTQDSLSPFCFIIDSDSRPFLLYSRLLLLSFFCYTQDSPSLASVLKTLFCSDFCCYQVFSSPASAILKTLCMPRFCTQDSFSLPPVILKTPSLRSVILKTPSLSHLFLSYLGLLSLSFVLSETPTFSPFCYT